VASSGSVVDGLEALLAWIHVVGFKGVRFAVESASITP